MATRGAGAREASNAMVGEGERKTLEGMDPRKSKRTNGRRKRKSGGGGVSLERFKGRNSENDVERRKVEEVRRQIGMK